MGEYGVAMYNKVSLETKVMTASPHELITMLMEGLLESCYKAKAYIQQNNIDGRKRNGDSRPG